MTVNRSLFFLIAAIVCMAIALLLVTGCDQRGRAALGGRRLPRVLPELRPMSAYRKAIVGGLIAVGGSIVTALGDNVISAQEIATAILAGLVALGAVWGVSNKTTP